MQAPDAESARRAAAEILSEGRFRRDGPPRPLKGVLETLGDWLQGVFEPVIEGLQTAVGGAEVFWLLVGLAVVLVAILVAARLGGRRNVRAESARARERPRPRVDPAALERAADDAEANGDFAGAVRLRFRAGVLRLARAGVIETASSLTSGQIRRAVTAPEFAELASAFDRIVYGRRTATAADAAAARERWQRVLASSGAR